MDKFVKALLGGKDNIAQAIHESASRIQQESAGASVKTYDVKNENGFITAPVFPVEKGPVRK